MNEMAEQVAHELKTGMPEKWTYTVRETTNTMVVTAKRPKNAGTYKLQTDRHRPLSDVREFIEMCRLFAGVGELAP